MHTGTKAALCAAMTAFATVASAGEACWTPRELQAARVRDVQTIMMVGALQCSTQGYNTSFGYDRFVSRNRAALVEHNEVLKRHFMRQAAVSTGQRDYDSFATKLANSHSIEANDMRNYCARVDSLVREAAAVHSDELAEFAAAISERPAGVGEDCGRAVVAEADAPPAPVYERARERRYDDRRYEDARYGEREVAQVRAPVETAEAVEVLAPAAAPAPVEVADVRRAPEPVEVAEVRRAPEPAPVEVAAVRRGPEPMAQQDDAVKQATLALQQATAALQAAIAAQTVSRVEVRPVAVTQPISAPAEAGPRRAPVKPVVLAPEPVVLPPETSQFVG